MGVYNSQRCFRLVVRTNSTSSVVMRFQRMPCLFRTKVKKENGEERVRFPKLILAYRLFFGVPQFVQETQDRQ